MLKRVTYRVTKLPIFLDFTNFFSEMAQDGEEIVSPESLPKTSNETSTENSTVPDAQEAPQTPPITDEQQSVLLSLYEICSEETLETCKRSLERNSWNLENTVMELISPKIEPTPGTVLSPGISASTTIIPLQTCQTPSAAAHQLSAQKKERTSQSRPRPQQNFAASFSEQTINGEVHEPSYSAFHSRFNYLF